MSTEKLLSLLAVRFHGGIDLIVSYGIDIAKGQIFEFAAKFPHAQAVRERRVNIEGFPRDGLLAFRLQMLQRAHIVETIGQLDEHDSYIRDHGQQHFTDVFRLTIFAVGELDFVDFGDTIDDMSDLFAKNL